MCASREEIPIENVKPMHTATELAFYCGWA